MIDLNLSVSGTHQDFWQQRFFLPFSCYWYIVVLSNNCHGVQEERGGLFIQVQVLEAWAQPSLDQEGLWDDTWSVFIGRSPKMFCQTPGHHCLEGLRVAESVRIFGSATMAGSVHWSSIIGSSALGLDLKCQEKHKTHLFCWKLT